MTLVCSIDLSTSLTLVHSGVQCPFSPEDGGYSTFRILSTFTWLGTVSHLPSTRFRDLGLPDLLLLECANQPEAAQWHSGSQVKEVDG